MRSITTPDPQYSQQESIQSSRLTRMLLDTMLIRKWLTRFTVSMFFLAGGIEYSVILPTALDYLTSPALSGGHHTGDWLYGLLLSAMSISHIFAGPLFGALFDRTHQTRILVMIALTFEVGANFMYFAAYTANSQALLLGSRFVAGIGIGAGAVLFGDIARTSTKKERTAVFTLYMSTRQFGLILGPAFNLFLRECNFNIGPFVVNKYTSPGLFMVIIWASIEVMYLFLFTHLPTVKEDEEEEEEGEVTQTPPNTSINDDFDEKKDLTTVSLNEELPSGLQDSDYSSARHSSKADEKSPLLSDNIQGSEHVVHGTKSNLYNRLSRDISKLLWLVNELMREEIVLLLALLFFTFFNQMTMETGLVPLVEEVLGWTEFETSIFFSVAGAVLLLAFLVMWLFSSRVSDRWMILFGLALQLFAYTWFLVLMGNRKPSSWVLVQVIVGSVVLIFGIPFFFVAGTSLYSKLLPRSIQGFGQGVRRSVGSLSAILGPLWAGGAFDVSDTLYMFYGVPLSLLVFIVVLTLLSFSRLRLPPPDTNKRTLV